MPTIRVPLGSAGTSIPAVAFGVGTKWFKKRGQGSEQDPNDADHDESLETIQAVRSALDAGFDHIDAAEMYGTEREIGQALSSYMQDSHTPRESIFVTTKVYSGLPNVRKALLASLARLKLTYVDLYLIHAPFKQDIDIKQAWQAMESLVAEGLTRHIGVSNFDIRDLEQLLPEAKIKPCVNQYERHPYLQQPELLEYCKRQGILVEVYGPLTPLVRKPGGPLDAVVEAVAAETGKSPGQVLLLWAAACGTVPCLTTSNKERLMQYRAVFEEGANAQLSSDQVLRISKAGADVHHRHFWVKEFADREQVGN